MKIDFNKMPCVYWSDVLKVSYLQRQIIIHSILYYELDSSVISDKNFDDLSKQLVKMQKELTKEEFDRTDYSYCMEDFDGSTGFDLYGRLTKKDKKRLTEYAKYILRLSQKERKRNGKKVL